MRKRSLPAEARQPLLYHAVTAPTTPISTIPENMKKQSHKFLWILGLSLTVWTLFGLLVLETFPKATPADPNSSTFSGLTALKQLEAITLERHPWASKANGDVGRFIMQDLEQLRQQSLKLGWHVDLETQDSLFTTDASLVKGSEAVTVDNHFSRIYSVPITLLMEPRNILFRFRSDPTQLKPALLLTGHFDSGVNSFGAFDDGIAVVTLLEVIRVLIQLYAEDSSLGLKCDLIFLFGNGEELGLLDAEAFVRHPWFNQTSAYINLEAGGNGNREMLFRSSDARFNHLYAQYAKRPHLNTLMSNLFESGIVPSDTNYRVLSLQNKLPGLDLAFYENRYSYHTSRDRFENVRPSSIQHVGDNVLSVLLGVLKNGYIDELGFSAEIPQFSLSFDFLTLFAVYMEFPIYVAWHVALLVVNIVLLTRKVRNKDVLFRRHVFLDSKVLMVSIVVSFLDACIAGYLVQIFNPTFVATYPGFAFALCAVRLWTLFLIVRHVFARHFNSISVSEQAHLSSISSLGLLSLLTTVSLTLGCRGYAALYILPVWTSFHTIASLSGLKSEILQLWIKSTIPFLLQLEIVYIFVKGLAPIVLDGLPAVAVFVIFAVASLLFAIPFYYTIPHFALNAKALRLLSGFVFAIWIVTLFIFPYSSTRSARIFASFEQNITAGHNSVIEASLRGPADLRKTLSRLDTSKLAFVNLGCDIDAGSKVLNPANSIARCTFQIQNETLIPFENSSLSLSSLIERIGSDGLTFRIRGTAEFLAKSYSCEMSHYLPNSTLSVSSQLDGMSQPLVTDHQNRFVLRSLRRHNDAPWRATFDTNVTLSKFEVNSEAVMTVNVRCLVDDWVRDVPIMTRLDAALPDWATVFSSGERTSSLVKTHKLKLQ